MTTTAAPVGRWLALSVAVIVADQLTKAAVLTAFRPGEELPLLPFLSLVLTFNRGAAFSFLAGADGWQRWLFATIAVAAAVFIVWLLKRGGNRLYCLGLALILGGAIGNVIDRVIHGYVVDFIHVHWGAAYFPAFNIADSAITVGAVLMILDAFREKRK